MNVSLTPELEEFVTNKVKSGRYSTASEVVREGLRLLEHRENKIGLPSFANKTELEALLLAGMKSMENGSVVDGKEVFDRLKKKAAAWSKKNGG